MIINNPIWGNQDLFVKNYFFEKSVGYNGAFIGSSLTGRQIESEVINNICSENGLKVYNLGAPRTIPPESFLYCLNLIENDDQLKTIFMELVPFDNKIQNAEDLSSKDYYFFNVRTLYFYLRHTYYQSKKKFNLNFAYNNIKNSIQYFLYYIGNVNLVAYHSLYNSESRFNKLAIKFQEEYTEAGSNRKLKEKQKIIDIEYLNQSMVGYRKALKRVNKKPDKSQLIYLDYINKITTKSSEKGIEVIWILPPCLKFEDFNFILPIYNLLNNKNKINMADPDEYPELYQKDYHYNTGHLNKKGSELYSISIAHQFNKIQMNN
jgi:hypothetical protein